MGFSTIVLVALVMMVVAITNRGRHRNDWRTMERDPRMGPRHGGPRFPSEADRDLQTYVEGLETRVAQLEERLDFTERLLMERPSRPSLPGRDRDASGPE
jgi:hypothetical protein